MRRVSADNRACLDRLSESSGMQARNFEDYFDFAEQPVAFTRGIFPQRIKKAC
jgi:hypothetical protein